MKGTKAIALASAALIAGLALGTVGIASASTASTSTTTTATAPRPPCGPGGGGGMRGPGPIADALAKLTGLTVSQIQTQRAAGTSYAAIASAKGVSTDSVIAATLALEKTQLEKAVTATGTVGPLGAPSAPGAPPAGPPPSAPTSSTAAAK